MVKQTLSFITCFTLCLISNGALGSTGNLTTIFLSEMERSKKSLTFEALLPSWEKRFGPKTLPALILIAKDQKQSDAKRYIALMSATHLGGHGILPLVTSLLNDSSWMLRSGALKALRILKSPETTKETSKEASKMALSRLNDPALVVRLEAIETIQALKPQGASQALLSTLHDRSNYSEQKAQWVPQKALSALVALHATETIPHLVEILKNPTHQSDPDLLHHVHQTLALLKKKQATDPGVAPKL